MPKFSIRRSDLGMTGKGRGGLVGMIEETETEVHTNA